MSPWYKRRRLFKLIAPTLVIAALSVDNSQRAMWQKTRSYTNAYHSRDGEKLGKVYVITLQGVAGAREENDKRYDTFSDDWLRMCGANLDIERCDGQLDPRRGFGLTQAYKQCFAKALLDDATEFFFFEDDARLYDASFCDPAHRAKLLTRAPMGTYLVLLGGHHFTFSANTSFDGYLEVVRSYGSYGFAVARESLKNLIEGYSSDLNSHKKELSPDVLWYKYAHIDGKKIFAINPSVVKHIAGFSNTWSSPRQTVTSGAPRRNKTITIFESEVKYSAPTPLICDGSLVVIGVISGYADKRSSVRDTWGKHQCVYFIVAKKYGQWPILEAFEYSDMIFVDLEDVYDGMKSILTFKTAVWFSFARIAHPNASFYMKTDDDSYVRVNALEHALLKDRPDFWGKVHRKITPIRNPQHKWYVPEHAWSGVYPDYCSGSGYVLSSKAVTCYTKIVAKHKFFVMEDVSTGALMRRCDFHPLHTSMVDSGGTFGENTSWIVKHYVKNHSELHMNGAK